MSTNPCSDTFCGDRAFSEVETANIRDYVLTISPVPTFGTAVHSAAELWLYPYGYDYNQFPDNVEEHVKSQEYQIMFRLASWRVMQKDVRTSRSTCTSFGK